MNEIKAKLRRLRIIQCYLIVSLVASATFAELTFGRPGSRWSSWHSLMVALAIMLALEGFRFRRRNLASAAAVLARDPGNPEALSRWAAWQTICLMMAVAVAGYGVLMRVFLRGTLWEALLFYVAGLFLLLLWTPRAPTAAV